MKIRSAEFITSAGSLPQIPAEDLPEIALAGRSNVGKSALINRLINRKNLAHTSNVPGKTRTLNLYHVNGAFALVDLPGYGFARRSPAERKAWADLVNGYLGTRSALCGILHILDARHDPTDQDLEMRDWLLHAGRPFLVVATKTDKLSGSRLKSRLDHTRSILSTPEPIDLLPFSAHTGRGRDALWAWIQQTVARRPAHG